MIPILLIFFLLCLAAMGYYFVAIYAAIRFFRTPIPINPDFKPPVTILKPLCGQDEETRVNLRSFCQQDYPTFQIIFSVRDATDPVIPLVKALIEEFPTLDLHLEICDRIIGSNLKVSNLANAMQWAKYDLLVLADSDIRVSPDYLQHIVQPMQSDKVAVVTCLYNAQARGKWSILESLGIATQFQPSILVARLVEGVHFAFGSTIVIRRTVLEQMGGFFAIADYLADDYQLGHQPTQLGYETVLSDYIVEHVLTPTTFREFWQRQARWMGCIRVERLGSYLGLIVTQGTILSLFFLLISGGSAWGWLTLAITWGLRGLMAWIVAVHYLHDPIARRYFWLLPIRDLFYFLIWGYSLGRNQVEWRGQTFKIGAEGKLIAETAIKK